MIKRGEEVFARRTVVLQDGSQVDRFSVGLVLRVGEWPDFACWVRWQDAREGWASQSDLSPGRQLGAPSLNMELRETSPLGERVGVGVGAGGDAGVDTLASVQAAAPEPNPRQASAKPPLKRSRFTWSRSRPRPRLSLSRRQLAATTASLMLGAGVWGGLSLLGSPASQTRLTREQARSLVQAECQQPLQERVASKSTVFLCRGQELARFAERPLSGSEQGWSASGSSLILGPAAVVSQERAQRLARSAQQRCGCGTLRF